MGGRRLHLLTQETPSSPVFLSILKKINKGKTIQYSYRNEKQLKQQESAQSYLSQEACSAFCSIYNHELIQRLTDFSGALLVISQTFGSDSVRTDRRSF